VLRSILASMSRGAGRTMNIALLALLKMAETPALSAISYRGLASISADTDEPTRAEIVSASRAVATLVDWHLAEVIDDPSDRRRRWVRPSPWLQLGALIMTRKHAVMATDVTLLELRRIVSAVKELFDAGMVEVQHVDGTVGRRAPAKEVRSLSLAALEVLRTLLPQLSVEAHLIVRLDRWTDDDRVSVDASLVDADGRPWEFREDPGILGVPSGRRTLPSHGRIPAKLVRVTTEGDDYRVTLDSSGPYGATAICGETEFTVRSESVELRIPRVDKTPPTLRDARA
jgi:hypothetical protein